MNFTEAKRAFLELYEKIEPDSKNRFCRWAGGYAEGQIESLPKTQTEELLDMISDELRKFVEPPGGRIQGEIVSLKMT